MDNTTKVGGQAAKRFDPTTLGGQAALATRETMPSIIWHSEVRSAVIGAAKDKRDAAAMVLEPETRARLSRMCTAGEPVWMAAWAILQFADGRADAPRECDAVEDMRRALRRAVRS